METSKYTPPMKSVFAAAVESIQNVLRADREINGIEVARIALEIHPSVLEVVNAKADELGLELSVETLEGIANDACLAGFRLTEDTWTSVYAQQEYDRVMGA
jgi:hypothetical protein